MTGGVIVFIGCWLLVAILLAATICRLICKAKQRSKGN